MEDIYTVEVKMVSQKSGYESAYWCAIMPAAIFELLTHLTCDRHGQAMGSP